MKAGLVAGITLALVGFTGGSIALAQPSGLGRDVGNVTQKAQKQTTSFEDDLTQEIAKLGDVSSSDTSKLKDAVAGYLHQGGTPQGARDVTNQAVDNGCKGICLVEAIRGLGAALAHGESQGQALQTVRNSLTAENQKASRSGKKQSLSDRAKQLHNELQTRLQAM